MIKSKIKFIIKLFYRPYLSLKYDLPLFPRYSYNNHRTLIDVLNGVKSIAIIGRGASIKEINPIMQIKNVDFVIIMNRVEIESLEKYIGKKVDAQIAQPPPPYAVLPKSIINKFGVKYISSNKIQSSPKFKSFFSSYFNRGVELLRYPNDDELKYDFTKYNVYAPTQCGSLMKIIFNVTSIKKVVFAGVDFFSQGYMTEIIKDKKIAPQEPHSFNLRKKGLPLLKYIKSCSKIVNFDRGIQLYFPSNLKKFIGKIDKDVIKFYD